MRKTLFTLAIVAAVAVAPAQAGTKDRVEVLERQVSDLLASQQASAQSSVRIAELEAQIQTLTGRIEQLSYELDQANAKLTAISTALAGGAPGPDGMAAGGPTALSGDPIGDQIAAAGQGADSAADVVLPMDPDAAFDYASSFLMAGDYARARAAFELYVKSFPNHSRTADAQFRLGEIYLATGANADAADTFIAHIKKYPNDPRAAEAYLKLGTAFARMEQNGEACKVFKAMKSKYPGAAPVVQQRADVEMARIGCN